MLVTSNNTNSLNPNKLLFELREFVLFDVSLYIYIYIYILYIYNAKIYVY